MEVDYVARFHSYTKRTPEGCLEWIGARNQVGYGNFRVGEKMLKAHRWNYARVFGPIAPTDTIHHKCFNRACVEPEHLEAMSQSANPKLKKLRTCPKCQHRFQ
jgi:hypothetical protein